jgi:hypothetical protein
MIKLRLLHNPHQGYCKYRNCAYEDFFELTDKLRVKRKVYKNGNRDYWFKNKDFKDNRSIIDALSFESIAFEVKKLK